MPVDHSRAPIVEALAEKERESVTSFGVPAHQSARGAPSDVRSLLGKTAFLGDATVLKGIDDRRMSKKIVEQAEELAAAAWGARRCFFSTNGSSLSNHAAMLAVAGLGDTVLVARNAHKSLIASLILGHVKPVFLEPDYDPDWDIEHGIPLAELERKLAAHPEAKGVFVTSPTYYGVSSDLKSLAKMCHRKKVPLVVDEAWGSFYPFHPEMPAPAIQCGADIALSSIHKTMAGLEQAAILLLNGKLIPEDRFKLCYDLFESTSMSVPILATIDATRRQFMQEGESLLGDVLTQARRTREKLAAIDGVRVMGREILNGDARCAIEDTKLYFDVGEFGVSGYEADDWVEKEWKIETGLCDSRCLLVGFGVGNRRTDGHRLVRSIRSLGDWAAANPSTLKGPPRDVPKLPELRAVLAMTPSEAFFARTEHVPLKKSAGRVAAEMVSPYPPGIPRLMPGQVITPAHVQYFLTGLKAGFFAKDPSDESLWTIRVVV